MVAMLLTVASARSRTFQRKGNLPGKVGGLFKTARYSNSAIDKFYGVSKLLHRVAIKTGVTGRDLQRVENRLKTWWGKTPGTIRLSIAL
jgi:hypothetical protein